MVEIFTCAEKTFGSPRQRIRRMLVSCRVCPLEVFIFTPRGVVVDARSIVEILTQFRQILSACVYALQPHHRSSSCCKTARAEKQINKSVVKLTEKDRVNRSISQSMITISRRSWKYKSKSNKWENVKLN